MIVLFDRRSCNKKCHMIIQRTGWSTYVVRLATSSPIASLYRRQIRSVQVLVSESCGGISSTYGSSFLFSTKLTTPSQQRGTEEKDSFDHLGILNPSSDSLSPNCSRTSNAELCCGETGNHLPPVASIQV